MIAVLYIKNVKILHKLTMFIFTAVFINVFFASIANATPFNVVWEAGSSTLSAGTYFPPACNIPSTTNDPLGPWNNQSVYFEGGYRDGSEANKDSFSTSITNGFMYRYKIDFSNIVQLDSLTIEGDTFYAPSTWQDNLILYDSERNIIGSSYTAFKNEGYHSFTINLSGITGRTFYLEEYDIAGVFNFRTNFNVEYSETDPVPEPATMLLFGTGLAGLVGNRLRRKKK